MWSEEDAEEVTLPDSEIPLVYSLHYFGQGRQERSICADGRTHLQQCYRTLCLWKFHYFDIANNNFINANYPQSTNGFVNWKSADFGD